MHLVSKRYSLAEAFGPTFPTDQSIGGFAPSPCPFVPARDPTFRWSGTLLRDLCVWWEHGGSDAVYLFGPRGVGKSSAIRQFCASLGIPMYEMTIYREVEFEDLVTVKELNNATTITSYGALPLAMGAEGWPGVFFANELDHADPDALSGMYEVLQGQPLLVRLGGVEMVRPDRFFRIVATGNSALDGDDGSGMVSAKEQDAAFAERFWCFYLGYPEPAEEEEILRQEVPDLPKELRVKMIEVANDIRTAFFGQGEGDRAARFTMSTRVLCRWAKLTYLFRAAQRSNVNPVGYALDRAWLNLTKRRPEVRRAIVELVRGRFGDGLGTFQ